MWHMYTEREGQLDIPEVCRNLSRNTEKVQHNCQENNGGIEGHHIRMVISDLFLRKRLFFKVSQQFQLAKY